MLAKISLRTFHYDDIKTVLIKKCQHVWRGIERDAQRQETKRKEREKKEKEKKKPQKAYFERLSESLKPFHFGHVERSRLLTQSLI